MRAEAAAGAASHPQTTATTTRTAFNTNIRFFLFQFLRRQFGILRIDYLVNVHKQVADRIRDDLRDFP